MSLGMDNLIRNSLTGRPPPRVRKMERLSLETYSTVSIQEKRLSPTKPNHCACMMNSDKVGA